MQARHSIEDWSGGGGEAGFFASASHDVRESGCAPPTVMPAMDGRGGQLQSVSVVLFTKKNFSAKKNFMMYLIRTPPLAPCDFRAKPARSRRGVSASRRGIMRSRGRPTARASCRWTQPRCRTSWTRADAVRATTSQLSGRAENGVSREPTVKVAAAFFPSF